MLCCVTFENIMLFHVLKYQVFVLFFFLEGLSGISLQLAFLSLFSVPVTLGG